MGKPCAKQGDQIVAVDIHLYPGSPPVPGPHPYTGIIQMVTQPKINVMGMPGATVGTKSMNSPPHAPAVDGHTLILFFLCFLKFDSVLSHFHKL